MTILSNPILLSGHEDSILYHINYLRKLKPGEGFECGPGEYWGRIEKQERENEHDTLYNDTRSIIYEY